MSVCHTCSDARGDEKKVSWVYNYSIDGCESPYMILAPNSNPLKSRKHSVRLSHLFSPIKRYRNFKCSPPFLAQTQFLKFHSYKMYIKIYWNFLNTTNLFSFWQSWWCNLGHQLQCFFFSCHFDTIKIVSIKVGLIR